MKPLTRPKFACCATKCLPDSFASLADASIWNVSRMSERIVIIHELFSMAKNTMTTEIALLMISGMLWLMSWRRVSTSLV